jgi:hypothetical protein
LSLACHAERNAHATVLTTDYTDFSDARLLTQLRTDSGDIFSAMRRRTFLEVISAAAAAAGVLTGGLQKIVTPAPEPGIQQE